MMYKYLFFILFLPGLQTRLLAQDPGKENTVNIAIKAIPGLQYDLVRFVVKPGARVTITLTNTDDMNHNLLLTRPGTRLKVVDAALQLAEKGPELNFIPKMDDVLWSVPVLAPGQVQSITFTAPATTGAYPYVCTYPGHGFIMFGAMYVSQDGALPPLTTDTNIPDSRRADAVAKNTVHSSHTTDTLSGHPYRLTPPYLYRVFIDGASPAAIVVRLPSELSYCWDAGPCKMRFAWKGGFVDNTELWKGHSDASAKILGDVFYRDNLDHPLRLGNTSDLPKVKFKGYRLVNNYPEFHYTINEVDVYELVHAKADGTGLVRQFRIPAAGGPVWFYTNYQDDTMGYQCATGKWKDGRLELTSAEASQFTVTMTSYPLAFQKKKKL